MNSDEPSEADQIIANEAKAAGDMAITFPVPIPLKSLPTPEPDTAPPQMVALEEMYASTLIGISVSADKPPRFCYSLNRLAAIEQRRSSVSPERARELTWVFVQRLTAEHGDRSPLFIDDAISAPQEKSRIIVPGRRGFRG